LCNNKNRKIRSFVRRQGRWTKAQKRAIDSCWDLYGIDVKNQKNIPDLFLKKQPSWLEIGFGDGENLYHMAKNNPHINFIGIEVYLSGIGILLQKLKLDPLPNLKISREDAIEVLSYNFTDNSMDKIFLLFPDPWHKKKHNKRRFVNKKNIDVMYKKLKTAGDLHIATDWQDYAEHTLDTLNKDKRWQNKSSKFDYMQNPPHRIKTKFEKRGLKLGHKIYDMIFKKI